MSAKRHTYDYEVDPKDDTAPARVVSMVRPGSKVLEIGAGPGSITRALIAKGCDVVALEVEESALQLLREVCAKVHALDLNDAGWAARIAAEHGSFDHVIAADVLEHVYDPWSVLGGMKTLLNDSGSVILSLPHAGHCAILACLVDEDFELRDWGLLDRTHIRFFGIKNIAALYQGQGLAIEEVRFVMRSGAMTEFAFRWNNLPDDMKAALTRNRFSSVYQVVARAVPVTRAERALDLMAQPVPEIAEDVARYWEAVMASQPVDPTRDYRSTLGLPTPTVTRKRARGLRRLIARLLR